MIKTPLSTVIGGAFWTPDCTVIGGSSPTFDQQIAKLFANGEQGFFYDPNDLSTMYQDAAGTVPVTSVGQPVGLILDKSKGLVLGAERLKNGDFNAGGANWNISGADGTHIVTFADGKLSYQSDTTSPVLSVSQSGALVPGRWYEVTINCSNYVSGSLKLDAGNGGILVASGLGTFTTKILALSSTFVVVRNSANVDLTIDSISVKEILGNHAYQTTSASRPILRKNAVTGANYLEFDGSDDFLQTSNIDFTMTDKVSLFAGVRKFGTTRGTVAELGTGGFGRFILNSNRLDTTSFSYLGENVSPFPSVQSIDSAVLSAQSNLSAKVHSLKANGVKTSSPWVGDLSTTYQNATVYIGRQGGTGFTFNGHIYGLIGIGKLTTDTETTAIEKELAKRVGATLNV